MTVPAVAAWKTNGHLIADAAQLGYLEGRVLDPTHGHGTWWTQWRPEYLRRYDINPHLGPDGQMDFQRIKYTDAFFDSVAFDPPFKLNGTPTPSVDERYGVHQPRTWQDRHALIQAGYQECLRVLKPGGYLLLKCQDQVCSGQVRWQTRIFPNDIEDSGLATLVDRFDMIGHARKQPMDGRVQKHAHGRASTLLVFQRSKQ